MSGGYPPEPWERSFEGGRWIIQHQAEIGKKAIAVTAGSYPESEEIARLLTEAPATLAALKAALGYLLNAAIDLETGCTKATAIRTLNGGIARTRAAIARATGAAS